MRHVQLKLWGKAMEIAKMVIKMLGFLILATNFLTNSVSAEVNWDTTSYTDSATFNQILEPVLKIYSFGKYAATLIAVLVLLTAGISYMLSGSDPRKRESAKSMAAYVFVGLIVIWAAPYAVNYFIG